MNENSNEHYDLLIIDNFSLFCSEFISLLKEEDELKYVTGNYADYLFSEFFDVFFTMYFVNFAKYSKFTKISQRKKFDSIMNFFFVNYFDRVESTDKFFRTKNIFTLYNIKNWINSDISDHTFISYNDFCRQMENLRKDRSFSFILTENARKYLLSKLKKVNKEKEEEEEEKKILTYFGILFDSNSIRDLKNDTDLYFSLKEILLNILREDGEMEDILDNFADLHSTISEIEENKNKNLNLLIEKYFLSNIIKEDSIVL